MFGTTKCFSTQPRVRMAPSCGVRTVPSREPHRSRTSAQGRMALLRLRSLMQRARGGWCHDGPRFEMRLRAVVDGMVAIISADVLICVALVHTVSDPDKLFFIAKEGWSKSHLFKLEGQTPSCARHHHHRRRCRSSPHIHPRALCPTPARTRTCNDVTCLSRGAPAFRCPFPILARAAPPAQYRCPLFPPPSLAFGSELQRWLLRGLWRPLP